MYFNVIYVLFQLFVFLLLNKIINVVCKFFIKLFLLFLVRKKRLPQDQAR